MKNPQGGSKQKTRKPSKGSTFQPFPVTSPEYSGAWMDEIESRGHSLVRERLRIWRESQSPQKSASKPKSKPDRKLRGLREQPGTHENHHT